MANVPEPATIWSPSIGNGEYNQTGINTITDASGNLLTDASKNTVVDNGLTFTQVPATVWVSSDGTQ